MNTQIMAGIQQLLAGEDPRGKLLLDASCSTGDSCVTYRAMGFEVVPSNYDPARFKVEGITCVRADLNEPWPFPSEQFHVVVLQEVIEHLENVALVFREVRRVLRPGGCFIFTTPNLLHGSSRLRLLATGFYEGRKKPLQTTTPPGDAPNWHVLPFHVYHWLCYHYQLRIERVIGTRKRWHSRWLAWPIYLLGAPYTYFWWVWSQADGPQREYNLDLWRYLFGSELLAGRGMAVKARKITPG